MHKSMKSYVAMLLGTAILSQSIAYGASAAQAAVPNALKSSAATGFALENLGSIALKGPVSVKLTGMDVFAQPGGNILTYTLNYYNGSGTHADLIDYFSKVTTPGGTVVQGKPVTKDVSIQTIPAKSSRSVTYYVNIGKAAQVSGIKVTLFCFDFNSANYQKNLGGFTIPGKYSTIVPVGQSGKLMMGELPIIAKAESLQKIQMNGKVYLKAGISLTNTGTMALRDPGYKAYLKSAGGSVFELKVDDAGGSYTVQPNEKKTIYYLTEVPSYMKTGSMTLQFVQEDTAAKVNLPVRSFSLPAITSNDAAVGDYAIKKISIAGNAVETQLRRASVYSENDSAKWKLTLRMKNLGNKPVTVPAYVLAVQAAEGYSIPIDGKSFSNLNLKPLEERLIELSADVPLKLNQGTLLLQLSEPDDEGKIIFPTALYKIPYVLESNKLIGAEYPLENNHGTFGVRLDSLQRLPWADGDQITAKISIRNTSLRSVQLPAFQALVKAGSSDLSGAAQIVAPNGLTALAPNAAAEVYVLANVPYSEKVNQLRIILQENSADDVTTFLTLNTNTLNSAIPTVDAGSIFQIGFRGKKAAVRERRTTVYGGSGSSLVYSELEVVNEEPRQSKQAQLVAYYKTSDDQYYEAEVSQSPNATGPGSKSLVTVWSKLPQSVNTSKLTLYIGEGIAEGKLIDVGGTPTGYICPVGLSLNMTPVKPSDLKSLDLFPYNLSVFNVVSTLSEGKDTLDMVIYYNLSKNEDYEAGPYGHKLILEVIDPYGDSTEKSLALGTDWTIGQNKSYAVNINRTLRNMYGGTIRLNLYDEFEGRRILLGSQASNVTIVKASSDAVERR
ncbi:hypothetical protein P9847_04450 [Paenibacillus chibensis]|uniref:DUF11 domain-containing protein n=1 Tax=Paenibacillus chibensis TaxID=59846 RepID=A0ABU6PNW2_9BACL|nr:hypothetical protein [Paenibacillus chibensis]